MAASESDIIKWQLKWIGENASELTANELELVISFEEQFKRGGSLSPRQSEILEEIYTRRT